MPCATYMAQGRCPINYHPEEDSVGGYLLQYLFSPFYLETEL